ncbi:MAG: chloride channel protein [Chitinophaga sp.]|uniref:chloride channel protein n=1 Tax=Chitinophaga sp. TaxID=1869181 RepID=UPI001B1BBA89|nr:chloride channel protein [Chitinophaga sp.]MBO9729048.1 chloride channel protein [Chitinophaga sp.]
MVHYITSRAFRIVPIPDGQEYTRIKKTSRVLYLSIAAMLVAAMGVAVGKLLTLLVQWLMALSFFGDISKEVGTPENEDLGIWIIVIPVAGALLLTWLSKYNKGFLNAIGLTVAIGNGAPMGIESPVMIFNGAIGNWIGKLLRCSPGECYVLFVAGTCSTLAGLFGAPIAAILLVTECFFVVVTINTMIPVILAAITAGIGSYLLRGATPVFNIPAAPNVTMQALLAYLGVGVLVGLWAKMSMNLSGLIDKLFGKLTTYSRWILLLAALVTGVAGYISPRALGTGNNYMNDLLQAHVTLSILVALAVVKLVAWLFFSSAYKTGSGIIPVLVTGGAAALLVGVVIQLLFPAVVIHSGTLVLAGMAAMLAGTSRALFTAMVLAVELTHDVNTILPVVAACCVSFCISLVTVFKTKAETI